MALGGRPYGGPLAIRYHQEVGGGRVGILCLGMAAACNGSPPPAITSTPPSVTSAPPEQDSGVALDDDPGGSIDYTTVFGKTRYVYRGSLLDALMRVCRDVKNAQPATPNSDVIVQREDDRYTFFFLQGVRGRYVVDGAVARVEAAGSPETDRNQILMSKQAILASCAFGRRLHRDRGVLLSFEFTVERDDTSFRFGASGGSGGGYDYYTVDEQALAVAPWHSPWPIAEDPKY